MLCIIYNRNVVVSYTNNKHISINESSELRLVHIREGVASKEGVHNCSNVKCIAGSGGSGGSGQSGFLEGECPFATLEDCIDGCSNKTNNLPKHYVTRLCGKQCINFLLSKSSKYN